MSGTSVDDSCASQCRGCAGNFAYFSSEVDVALKGFVRVGRWRADGAVGEHYVRAAASLSNRTRLVIIGARLERGGRRSTSGVLATSSDGSFLVFASCTGGGGCFFEVSGYPAVFRRCLFMGSVGAM
jgi:hypothetical protein